jgi:hypothetical protein
VRQAELRRQLAQKFALATNEVSKFIDMVRTAEEFEDYQTEDRKRDHYVVKHRAAEAFEYFDELSKGKSAGGVQHTLNQDESFKHLVFDLLFDGKFKRWDLIRDLKHVAGNEEARDMLRRAAVMSDQGEAQDLVTDACAMVKLQRREQRTLGANQRIEAFCKWFDDLPVAAFREGEPGAVSRANLGRLHVVLKNVEANLAVAAEGHDAG